MAIIVRRATSETSAQWESYVRGKHGSCNYHRWGWKGVIESSFGWQAYYLAAYEGESIVGVLPLILQTSRIFGRFLTSIPFFSYGGVLGDSNIVERTLVAEAVAIAKKNNVGFMELRHGGTSPEVGLEKRDHKITFIRELPANEEELWKSLDSKVRADVRKANSYGLVSEVAGQEGLDEFYTIFAINMRDLGTPVYSKRFFENIFNTFPSETRITIVRSEGRAIASSFLCGNRETLEVPWSSSLREFLKLKPNMSLYWRNLTLAIELGYKYFDFGRSSYDSGTQRFKTQWGPQPTPLSWICWSPDGKSTASADRHDPKYELAVKVWQKLPLSIANSIGPVLSRCLP
jgi:serine/alanine adding enzyme